MDFVVLYIVTFLVVYLLYLFTVILNKKKLEKFKKSNQALFFVKKYNVKLDETNTKYLANLVALTNAFIISTVLVIVEIVSNFILKLLMAFLLIIPLILILYNLIGKMLKKRGNK